MNFKMNKKAQSSSMLMNNIIYVIILVIFAVGMMMFIYSKMNGAAVWQDFYAKDIVKMIDSAKPGESFIINVQGATEIAKANKVSDFEKIFQFDNLKNQVCVQLGTGKASCFRYFNEVSIGYDESGKWIALAQPENMLHFRVVSKGAKS